MLMGFSELARIDELSCASLVQLVEIDEGRSDSDIPNLDRWVLASRFDLGVGPVDRDGEPHLTGSRAIRKRRQGLALRRHESLVLRRGLRDLPSRKCIVDGQAVDHRDMPETGCALRWVRHYWTTSAGCEGAEISARPAAWRALLIIEWSNFAT